MQATQIITIIYKSLVLGKVPRKELNNLGEDNGEIYSSEETMSSDDLSDKQPSLRDEIVDKLPDMPVTHGNHSDNLRLDSKAEVSYDLTDNLTTNIVKINSSPVAISNIDPEASVKTLAYPTSSQTVDIKVDKFKLPSRSSKSTSKTSTKIIHEVTHENVIITRSVSKKLKVAASDIPSKADLSYTASRQDVYTSLPKVSDVQKHSERSESYITEHLSEVSSLNSTFPTDVPSAIETISASDTIPLSKLKLPTSPNKSSTNKSQIRTKTPQNKTSPKNKDPPQNKTPPLNKTLTPSEAPPNSSPCARANCNTCTSLICGSCSTLNTIYLITCIIDDCNATYIGETYRTLHERFTEHWRTCASPLLDSYKNKALSNHYSAAHPGAKPELRLEILGQEKSTKKRKEKETSFILERKSSLNIKLKW